MVREANANDLDQMLALYLFLHEERVPKTSDHLYVDGVFAGDGVEQDVYVFGASEPIRSFTGKVIAVWHRLNDCEDKWIVSIDGAIPDKDEILRLIEFQEQYFMGELYI